MTWRDRAEILCELSCVGNISLVEDDDGTVCEALCRLDPGIFANGGDRTEADPRESAVCDEFGIEQRFNVGGGKIASSSELVEAVR